MSPMPRRPEPDDLQVLMALALAHGALAAKLGLMMVSIWLCRFGNACCRSVVTTGPWHCCLLRSLVQVLHCASLTFITVESLATKAEAEHSRRRCCLGEFGSVDLRKRATLASERQQLVVRQDEFV